MEKIKIMFNEDPNHHIGETEAASKYLGRGILDNIEQTEHDFVYQYKGTQLTDYLINVNFMCSTYPSKTRDSYGYKVGKRLENGEIVDYGEENVFRDVFFTDKFDLFGYWVKTFREIGVRPWLSFRMNDCHDLGAERSFMQSDFYYKHPEYRRVRHHIPTTYFSKCFDYGIKEVRDDMLAYIDESLDRYDVDGIELDFMREMFCFAPGEDYKNTEVMTEYIREIKRHLLAREKTRGHKIMLGIRLFSIPHQVFYAGFDIFTYAKEKLIDVLVVSPRWETADNDMPIEVWKKLLEPYDVQLGAAIELILRCNPKGRFYYLNTHETALGSAAQNMSAGAFTYLFNYMHPNCIDYTRQLVYPIYLEENYQKLLCNAGELETALAAPRRHVATFHDIEPEWEACKLSPFPMTVDNDKVYHLVRIRCGIVPENSSVWLVLGCEAVGDDTRVPFEDFDVYINSHKLTCSATCDLSPHSLYTGYCFKIDDISILSQVNTVEISSEGVSFRAEMAEIRVNVSI